MPTKVKRKTGTKFRFGGRRVIIMVEYKHKDYPFLKPEVEGKYESKNVKLNEKAVYGDLINFLNMEEK